MAFDVRGRTSTMSPKQECAFQTVVRLKALVPNLSVDLTFSVADLRSTYRGLTLRSYCSRVQSELRSTKPKFDDFGIESAGISDNLPMRRNRNWGIAAKGGQNHDVLSYVPVFVYFISPGYLKAIGMRLMEGPRDQLGRWFE